MSREIDVSVVIVSYNTENLLDACLSSVFKQTRCAFEVIVIDNASTDESLQIVRSKYPDVVLVSNDQNVGFAAANNQGFAIAKGCQVLMLNPDTAILDSAIDVMCSFLDDNPDVGAVGAQNLKPGGGIQKSCHHFPTLWTKIIEYAQLSRLFPHARWAGKANMSYWCYDEVKEVDWLSGSCMMIRGEALRQVGHLDDAFFLYMEEVDWCFRAKKIEWKVVYTPEAKIVHYHGMSSGQLEESQMISKNISKHYFASHYYYFRKHYGHACALATRALDVFYGLLFYVWNLPRRSEIGRIKRIRSLSIIKHALIAKANS